MQDPNAPRMRAKGANLSDLRSSFSTSKALSPRTALPPISGNGRSFSPERQNGGGYGGNGNGAAAGRNGNGHSNGHKRGSPDSPLEDLDGNELVGGGRGPKAARQGARSGGSGAAE